MFLHSGAKKIVMPKINFLHYILFQFPRVFLTLNTFFFLNFPRTKKIHKHVRYTFLTHLCGINERFFGLWLRTLHGSLDGEN